MVTALAAATGEWRVSQLRLRPSGRCGVLSRITQRHVCAKRKRPPDNARAAETIVRLLSVPFSYSKIQIHIQKKSNKSTMGKKQYIF
jgi:uncharacterized protein YggU (UPF0235/DUF167 family)